MTEPTSTTEWNADGLALCACHGHLDGLTLEEMAALGAPCPTASHFAAEVAAAEKRGYQAALEREPARIEIVNPEGVKSFMTKEIAEAEKRGAVKALREAAYKFAEGAWNDAFLVGNVVDDVSAVRATEAWLNAEADRIEADS